METNKEKASVNDTDMIGDEPDDFAKLFDSSYWDTQVTFPLTDNQPMDAEGPFVMDESKLGANEKYIRNYTRYQFGNAMCSKAGGLVIDGEYCGFEEGYIKPGDVLFYREADSSDIKEICFSDLLPVATQHFPLDTCSSMYFAIHFRSIETGEFYWIGYEYDRLYETDALTCDAYPDFYARKADYTERQLLEDFDSGKYGIRLHNTRKFKLIRLMKLEEGNQDQNGWPETQKPKATVNHR